MANGLLQDFTLKIFGDGASLSMTVDFGDLLRSNPLLPSTLISDVYDLAFVGTPPSGLSVNLDSGAIVGSSVTFTFSQGVNTIITLSGQLIIRNP